MSNSKKPRKIRNDATLESVLKRAGINDPQVLKTKTGRRVRKDVKIGTLQKRAEQDNKD